MMRILNGFFAIVWITNAFLTGLNIGIHNFHGFGWWGNLFATVGGGFLLVRGYVNSEDR